VCGNAPESAGWRTARYTNFADHSITALDCVEGPTRNPSVKPHLLDRDLPNISVEVVHLNKGTADGKRHLPCVLFHDLVAET
jgi:hypothetical protein